MRHFSSNHLLCLLLLLGTPFYVQAQFPRSPYYTARPGTAQLTDARLLKGKFYYHVAPLSHAVSFYFYSKGTASQQIIPASRIKTLTVAGRLDTATHFTMHQRSGRLFITNAKRIQQEVTQAIFVNL